MSDRFLDVSKEARNGSETAGADEIQSDKYSLAEADKVESEKSWKQLRHVTTLEMEMETIYETNIDTLKHLNRQLSVEFEGRRVARENSICFCVFIIVPLCNDKCQGLLSSRVYICSMKSMCEMHDNDSSNTESEIY